MKAFCLIQFALWVRKQKHILCAETGAFNNDFYNEVLQKIIKQNKKSKTEHVIIGLMQCNNNMALSEDMSGHDTASVPTNPPS